MARRMSRACWSTRHSRRPLVSACFPYDAENEEYGEPALQGSAAYEVVKWNAQPLPGAASPLIRVSNMRSIMRG